MVQNSTGASGTDDSKRPLISSDQKVVEYLTFYSLEKEEKEKEDGNGPKGMIED